MSNDNNLIPTQAQTRWGFIEDVSIKEEKRLARLNLYKKQRESWD